MEQKKNKKKIGTWDGIVLRCVCTLALGRAGAILGVARRVVGVGGGGGDGSKAAEVMRSPSLLSLLITVV